LFKEISKAEMVLLKYKESALGLTREPGRVP